MMKYFFKTAAPLKNMGELGKGVLTILMLVTFKTVIRIYILYPYDVHIPLNMGGGGVSHAGNELTVIYILY